jgi:hypothetical protein
MKGRALGGSYEPSSVHITLSAVSSCRFLDRLPAGAHPSNGISDTPASGGVGI